MCSGPYLLTVMPTHLSPSFAEFGQIQRMKITIDRGKNTLSIRFGIIPMLSIELEVKYFIRFTKTFRKCKKGSSWENVHHHLVHGKYHCQSIHIFVYKKYWKLILMNSVHSTHYIIFFLPFIHCTLEMASIKQMCVSILEFSIMKSL